ncbi:MAG: hypothetical protein V4540_04070 [Pseudomonadota bacterium]
MKFKTICFAVAVAPGCSLAGAVTPGAVNQRSVQPMDPQSLNESLPRGRDAGIGESLVRRGKGVWVLPPQGVQRIGSSIGRRVLQRPDLPTIFRGTDPT